jgi:hypothetical protein
MKRKRFIEYSYVLFPIMIVITLFFTFSTKNNFTADYDNQIGLMSGETRSKKEIEAFAQKELIEPFLKLRVQDLQNAKNDCLEHIEHKLIFNYNYKEEADLPFYKDQMVSARVMEVDCEREYYLYTMKIYFDEKKILVQTTIFDEWVTPKEFLAKYKQRITKN